jgi:hypothetical protein
MKDVFYCSDPFENMNYQTTCSKDEDVCLKVSARGKTMAVDAEEKNLPKYATA